MDTTLRVLLETVRDTLGLELEELAKEATRARTLLAESVGGLSESFCGLAAKAEAQKQVLEKLLASLGNEETRRSAARQASMDAFVRECAQILRSLTADLDELSAHSSASVVEIGALAVHVDKSLALLGEIEKISASAQFLALNAQIEAARAGVAGQGFAVVAAEVKQVARQSRDLAERISDQVGSVRGSLEGVRRRMTDSATRSASVVGESRERVDVVLRELDALGQSVAAGLAQLGGITAEVRETAARAVRALQFEDIIGQLVGTILHRIQRLRVVADALGFALDGQGAHRALALLEKTADLTRNAPVKQTSMGAGAIELF